MLDVLNSGVGVVSPLLGGIMMGTMGSGHTPHAGALLHAVLGFALLQILPLDVDVLQTRVQYANQGRSKAKQE